MLIRLGYELVYDCPQPTPMLLTLNVHYTRISDIVVPDHLVTSPSIPIRAYRDSFGNWCNRIGAPEGRTRLRRKLEIYTHRRPIQKVTAGDTLRILDQDRFELVWSIDGWKSSHRTASRGLGSAGFSADVEIPATAQPGELSWTLQRTEEGRWLGYNVQVRIETDATN